MPVDPASLRIRTYPDDILRVTAEPVDPTPEVAAVAHRMIELMRQAEGIGLAATQVGLPWRLFVADVPQDPTDRYPDQPDTQPQTADTAARHANAARTSATQGPTVYLNPNIDAFDGPPDAFEEGCLSLPNIRGDVLRPPRVTMTAIDLNGRPFITHADGLLARCLQHELDHLDGVLIFDRMTQRARLATRGALTRLERQA